jgi:hypothetical protein
MQNLFTPAFNTYAPTILLQHTLYFNFCYGKPCSDHGISHALPPRSPELKPLSFSPFGMREVLVALEEAADAWKIITVCHRRCCPHIGQS